MSPPETKMWRRVSLWPRNEHSMVLYGLNQEEGNFDHGLSCLSRDLLGLDDGTGRAENIHGVLEAREEGPMIPGHTGCLEHRVRLPEVAQNDIRGAGVVSSSRRP